VIVLLVDWATSVPLPVLMWLTASGVTGFLAAVEPD
jgi:hypothetical protein